MAKQKTVTRNDVDEARALLALMESNYQEQASAKPKAETPTVPERKAVSAKSKTETPVNRFKRICGGRAGRVKRGIETIAACSGNGYEYTEQQVDKIEYTLQQTLDNTIAVLRAGLNPRPKTIKDKTGNPNFMEL